MNVLFGIEANFLQKWHQFLFTFLISIKWQVDQGKYHLFQYNIILCFKKHADISVPSVKLLCEQQARLIKVWRPICIFFPAFQHSSVLSVPLFPLIPLLHKASSVLFLCFNDRAGEQQHKLELLKARDPGQHSRADHADTSWGQAPGWHLSAGSVSSNLLQFLELLCYLFLSHCLLSVWGEFSNVRRLGQDQDRIGCAIVS